MLQETRIYFERRQVGFSESSEKVSDRHAEHGETQKKTSPETGRVQKAPDLSIVVRCGLRDEPALQLERSASTQGQADTVPLHPTSKTSPGPVMLLLSWVENNSTNPTDHSLALL